MLERWREPAVVPSNNAAVSRVEDHVLSLLQDKQAVVLEIRFDNHDVSARDFAAYLTLLDGIFGRTDPRGFRSYSLRASDHLAITRVESGSTVLEVALAELGNVDAWRLILVYLVARTGPSILKGEAAKNWAEAAKALGEATLVWSDVAKRASASRERAKLERRQRASIRKMIQSDPLFVGLPRRDIDVLVQMVEEILLQESGRLSAAARFDDDQVIEIALRLRRRGLGGDAV